MTRRDLKALGVTICLLILAPTATASEVGEASEVSEASEVDSPPEIAAPAPAGLRLLPGEEQRRLREIIIELESQHGAYSPVLPEQLLSLGMALQRDGLHADAVSVFKRGTHLARVSDGLYSRQQLPLLESEIRSLEALGDYRAVDERQSYLYRVQQKALQDPRERARALSRQADWQRQAYLMGLDEEPGYRLQQMWELNRLALNEILEHEGDRSFNLLVPLYGMLQAHYLIAELQRTGATGPGTAHGFSERGPRTFDSGLRRDLYEQGSTVIRAIHDLESLHSADDPAAPLRALALLGDWMLWHGRRAEAMEVYRLAVRELAANPDAQAVSPDLFARPVPLPAFIGLDQQGLVAGDSGGDILLQVAVRADGRVASLDRVDGSGQATGAANRLMRKLRRTPFRPRFDLETGEPVDTDNLIMSYDSRR